MNFSGKRLSEKLKSILKKNLDCEGLFKKDPAHRGKLEMFTEDV
jgi:hypothetical protein